MDKVVAYPIFKSPQFGKKKEVICLYDFSVNGGAMGDYVLCKLPKNTVITNVIFDVVTSLTSGGSATVALKANSANDLLSALGYASLTGIYAGIPVGTAGTSVKLTADRDITMTIGSAALTAGKFVVHIEYFEGGE